MKKIIVKIGKTGEIQLEAEGFKGNACMEKTKKYIEGLGKEETNEKKPEYYEQGEVLTSCGW